MSDRTPSSEELSENTPKVIEYLQKESDRGCALVSVAFLDDVLRRLLLESLREGKTTKELLKGELATIDSRMKMAYVLGHIDRNEYNNLKIICRIRNKFAHFYDEIDFKEDKISKLCQELSPRTINAPNSEHYPIDNERYRFILAVVEYMNTIQLTTLSLKNSENTMENYRYLRKGPLKNEEE